MLDDMEQKVKEKLLEQLIEKMSNSGSDRMKPKGLGVEVQAPDKEHLAEGLEKAKDLLGHGEIEGEDHSEMPDNDDDSDEARMAALLEHDDDDDDEKGR